MFKLYLSPSTQEDNLGVDKVTEETRMQALGRDLKEAIEKAAGDKIEVRANRPEMSVGEIVRDSNSWGAQAHLALHTNAGGPRAAGLEVYSHAGSAKGTALGALVFHHLYRAGLVPRPGAELRDPLRTLGHRLAEVDVVAAPACLVELVYHTNQQDLDLFASHREAILTALTEAVIEYVTWAAGGGAVA
jgi:N-acetylmuramoyl-L-alanine amidase